MSARTRKEVKSRNQRRETRSSSFPTLRTRGRLIEANTTGEKSSGSSVALLRGHRSFFSGGRFLSADPLDPPALWIWQSQHRLVHSAVSKTWQAQKSSGI